MAVARVACRGRVGGVGEAPRSRLLQFPTASGATGTTWNFQLRPTFWFGLTLCDTESAPEFTKNCNPDTDANNLVNPNPNSPDHIGKHPGNAFMELQFYGPGYVPQFEGFGCTAHQYCAAMTIDSLSLDQIRIHMHDTAAGFRIDLVDLTTRVVFPDAGFTTSDPISDFNSGDRFNPCPTFGRGFGH